MTNALFARMPWLWVGLMALAAPVQGQFALNQRVQTIGSTAVSVSVGGATAGVQLPGGTGTITGGPAGSGGSTEWQVQFDVGASGWVLGSQLTGLATLPLAVNRWVNVTPTYAGAPNGGFLYPQGWGNKNAYDPRTHRVIVSDRWYDSIRGGSIFANGIHALDVLANTFNVLKLNNWFVNPVTCQNGTFGCYQTTPLPANTTDPTPPDHHPLAAFEVVPEYNVVYSVNGVNSISLPDLSILNRTWKLNLATRAWTLVSSATTDPDHPANNGASTSGLVWDPISARLVYFVPNLCGCSGTTTYVLNPATDRWTKLPQDPTSLEVYVGGAGVAYDSRRGVIYAYGGSNFISSDATRILYSYSVALNRWTRLADAPVEAMAPALAYDQKHDRLLALVGNNTYLYNPVTNVWQQYPATLLRPQTLPNWQSVTYDIAYDVFVFQGGTYDAPLFSLFRLEPAVAPTVAIDTHAPSVNFLTPAAGATVAGTVNLSVNAVDTIIPNTTDAVGVVSVQYKLDGVKLGAPQTDGASNYATAWTTTRFSNGPHVISATAYDSVGNSATASLNVTVNNVVPPPVITQVAVDSVTSTSAIITWTTDTDASSQVLYGVTPSYGLTAGATTNTTRSHGVQLTGLTPGVTYQYQVTSARPQGSLASSANFSFTTLAAGAGPQTLLAFRNDSTEVSGLGNGALVTPTTRPSGFTGSLVVRGTGSVNFAPGQAGQGSFFLNCCDNANNAYYKFGGSLVGNIFNVSQGQITFYIKSRYNLVDRPAGLRYVFDVREDDPNRHWLFFHTQKASDQLVFTYNVGGGPQFYFVPPGTEDQLYGAGRLLRVAITWSGGRSRLFLNGLMVVSSPFYAIPSPIWTSASNFNLGAFEYVNLGGYNSSDDLVDEFAVSGPPIVIDTTPPTVAVSAPAPNATVNGLVNLTATASDNIGIASLQFELDGGALGSPIAGSGPTYTLAWNSTSVSNGSHTIRAIARDAAGNSTTSSTISVNVANPAVAPVISGVSVGPVSSNSATINWTTDIASNGQVAYGLTSTYGSLSGLASPLVTSHSILLAGLQPSTTYRFQVISRTPQGGEGRSADAVFTTPASPFGAPLLLISGDAGEVAALSHGAVITPTLRPPGFTGSLVLRPGGSVNFAPAQVGNGVYFLNCCDTSANAYYRFTGTMVGNLFNVSRGQVSFYLKSRYNVAQRPAGLRFAFDVRDQDPNNHLYFFHTQKTAANQILFTYNVGGGAQFYYLPAGQEDAIFGAGLTVKITITWDGVQSRLYLNDAVVQSSTYIAPTPNWTAASNFNLGAYEYATVGGYNSLDDVIDDFTVSGPPIVVDTTPPAVTMTAPAAGASVTGSAVTVSANATDNVGVTSVQMQLDGLNLGAPQSNAGPNYTLSWDSTEVTNGAHTLRAVARDAAGNSTTSGAISISVNNPLVAPVVSGAAVANITFNSATVTWVTDRASTSQAAYGLTSAYGSLTALDSALVTVHSVMLTGLAPSTTYHVQAISRTAQGGEGRSAELIFSTPASPFGAPLLHIAGEPSELSGLANGATVTPTLRPGTLSGTLVVKGAGSVNFEAAQNGQGVFFLNCCDNTANAYYRFTNSLVGNLFNVNQGQISFYLKSRRAYSARPAGVRYVFDVRDSDPNRHLFFFHTQKVSGALLFTYNIGGGPQFFYVPAGTEETLFGLNKIMKVAITWDGTQSRLWINDVQVQSSNYVKQTPNWSAAANFNLGAYEYSTIGGYNALDDAVDEFTVSGPPIVIDTTAPAVNMTAPASGSTVSGASVGLTANATDNVGVTSVQFQLDGVNLGAPVTGAGPAYSAVWDTTATSNGTHTLRAVARDAAGNAVTSAAIAVTVSNPVLAPVITGAVVSAVTYNSAVLSWTTDRPADTQATYGVLGSYGNLTPLDPSLATIHTVVLTGLAASTMYQVQAISRTAQGGEGRSADLVFTTGASPFGSPLLRIAAEPGELSGVSNGSVVTPALRPGTLTGTLVVRGAGSVNFAPAQVGQGAYFLNCCDNTANSYYKFTHPLVGNIFNVDRGQISFFLKSRSAFASRPAGVRYAFDVRDNDPNRHLFFFHTQKSSGFLLFTYNVGGGPQFYYVPAGTEESLFGLGRTMKVSITWDGTQSRLYLNDVQVQSANYVKPVPNWGPSANFNLGAYEYSTVGGFNSSDDVVDEFSVSGPPIVLDVAAPAVSVTAPAQGANVAGAVGITAQATDNVAVTSVQFQLNGVNLGAPVSGPGPLYTLNWDSTSVSNGLHLLRAIARDAAGNSSTSAAVSVNVSNAAIAPVIAGAALSAVTHSSVTLTWTTDRASDSQAAYGLTAAYGSLSNLDPALVTSHSLVLSGLTPSTTYQVQAISRTPQGGEGRSANLTFTTAASPYGVPVLRIAGEPAELNGTTNGATVTPTLRPGGFAGTLVVRGAGSVNFAPAQAGQGVYFQQCCDNTSNAYYKFTGSTIGSLLNVNRGEVSFALQSRYNLANRPAGVRYVFDARDGDPNNHPFFFSLQKSAGTFLLLTYRVGRAVKFYYIPAGTEDALFGIGKTIRIRIAWDGTQSYFYLNDSLVQTATDLPSSPNWSASSVLNLGAYEYLNVGGFNSLDDILDEFVLTAPAN